MYTESAPASTAALSDAGLPTGAKSSGFIDEYADSGLKMAYFPTLPVLRQVPGIL
jgi:hypothetical protein